MYVCVNCYIIYLSISIVYLICIDGYLKVYEVKIVLIIIKLSKLWENIFEKRRKGLKFIKKV